MKMFYCIKFFPKGCFSPGVPHHGGCLLQQPCSSGYDCCHATNQSANPADSFKVYSKCNQSSFPPPPPANSKSPTSLAKVSLLKCKSALSAPPVKLSSDFQMQ